MEGFAMFKFAAAISITLCLAACNDAQTPKSVHINEVTHKALPPFVDYISCLPQETALMAAHRGTARRSKYPENSLSALKALIEKNYLVAEVDVASLKDGVHILYHDGVWDEKSTGKGAVASSTWMSAEKILLEDTMGRPSSDRPVKFEDYLLAAKGKIYLEIDFKSSSKYKTVIDLIRKHNMANHVILISYNEVQTKKLSRLAPDMMLSIGHNEALKQTRFKPGQVAAWIGYDIHNSELVQNLRDKDVPILGRVRKGLNRRDAKAADIIITDYIFDVKPILGLTKTNEAELKNCLAAL